MKLEIAAPIEFIAHYPEAGGASFSLPSIGASLILDEKELDLAKIEAQRFFRASINHSHYTHKRAKTQKEYILFFIEKLKKDGYLNSDGFTELAINSDNISSSYFSHNVVDILDEIHGSFQLNRKLNEVMHMFGRDKLSERQDVALWPSLSAMEKLPTYKEEDIKIDWSLPFFFSSSGNLAGMVKPVIFHNQTLDISLSGGAIKLRSKNEDSLLLLSELLSEEEISLLNVAKKAWSSLGLFSNSLSLFSEALHENGYESSINDFYPEDTNVKDVHLALITLVQSITSELGATKNSGDKK